jgi:hypothetical protein
MTYGPAKNIFFLPTESGNMWTDGTNTFKNRAIKCKAKAELYL